VEIESCSSGGGRADFEILERTCRIWTSDSNDALDRQVIQRGFSYLFPPELMGAHIGPPRSHTTGRVLDLGIRAATALFGHLGVEWNLLDATDDALATLAATIALHRRLRPLLHAGTVVRLEHPDPAAIATAVVAGDLRSAVISIAAVGSTTASTPPPLRIDGLDPALRYQVERLRIDAAGDPPPWFEETPAWLDAGVELPGATLAAVGLHLPSLLPGTALLLVLTASS